MKIKFIMPHDTVVSSQTWESREDLERDLKVMGFTLVDGVWSDGETRAEIIK